VVAIENDVVAEVARALIVAVAPQELPLFHSVSEAFFKDPARVRPRGRGNDDVLGFGTVEATLLTPIVLTMVTHVGMYLAEEIGKDIDSHCHKIHDRGSNQAAVAARAWRGQFAATAARGGAADRALYGSTIRNARGKRQEAG
jgi:hypothetical protein